MPTSLFFLLLPVESRSAEAVKLDCSLQALWKDVAAWVPDASCILIQMSSWRLWPSPRKKSRSIITHHDAGESRENFPGLSKFAGNFSQEEFRRATAFSSFLTNERNSLDCHRGPRGPIDRIKHSRSNAWRRASAHIRKAHSRLRNIHYRFEISIRDRTFPSGALFFRSQTGPDSKTILDCRFLIPYWKLVFFQHCLSRLKFFNLQKAAERFTLLGRAMRASLSAWPKCSHGCVSLKRSPMKIAQILTHGTKISTEPTFMRMKWFSSVFWPSGVGLRGGGSSDSGGLRKGIFSLFLACPSHKCHSGPPEKCEEHTPYRAIFFQGGLQYPKIVRYPPPLAT